MGAAVPKQFLRLGGKTILQLSIERMVEAVPDVKLVLALPEGYFDFWARECREKGLECRMSLVPGGQTRFHSVKSALSAVPDNAAVAVHDAVRPFAGVGLIRGLFAEVENVPAAVPVIPVTDTLKVLDASQDGSFRARPGAEADRSVLFGAQTPQLFRSEILKAAYSQEYEKKFTDDASLVEAYGVPVKYVLGEKYNIKITTPEDMALAGLISSSL